MNLNIKNDDVLHDLTTYPDTEFHTIFCDPPYNLGTEWTISPDGRPVVKNKAKDFMGKWEGFDENSLEKFYADSFRVLKHGGFLVMFGLDRQLMPFNYYAMKAGFDVLQSLHWFFASSFPKASDVSKMLDKRLGCERTVVGKTIGKGGENLNKISRIGGNDADEAKGWGAYGTNAKQINVEIDVTVPSSDLAKQFDGYKYSISPFKQCTETIMVFRKPPKVSILDDIIDNDPECSPSCINIDGGRVPIDPLADASQLRTMNRNQKTEENGWGMNQNSGERATVVSESGRYPATVFVDETMSGVLDKQSGIQKSIKGKVREYDINNKTKLNNSKKVVVGNEYSDRGGCSRVLHRCRYEDGDFDLLNYCSKVSGKERNAGLDHLGEKKIEVGHNRFDTCATCGGTILQNPDRPSACKCENPVRENNKMMKNHHPTVKPISLIEKISTLFKLPIDDQKLYIPFGGVFSEVIGCHKAGFRDITVCELSDEYIEIGKARFNHWCEQSLPTELTWEEIFS